MRTRPILLVEDNEDDVSLTLRAFQQSHIANPVVIVGDGLAAIEYLDNCVRDPAAPTPPAVVLLDLKLPKIDGLDVLRHIRADPRQRRQPVVVLTSSKEEQDIMMSYDIGANSYIRKPVDFERFCEAMRQLGLYWLVLNEPPPTRPRMGDAPPA
ncbi:MAG: response regulator [Opitutae bacterium]|nr:response regulator [Opitutae bacterium]